MPQASVAPDLPHRPRDAAPTLKLALTGKGGAGKTALSALLCRALADRGRRVLAVDLDSNPGLAVSLGVEAMNLPLPEEAIAEDPAAAYGWGLSPSLRPEQVVDRYAGVVDEHIRFIGFGNVFRPDNPTRRFITAVRKVAEGFSSPGWATVADIGAGPSTPFEGYAGFADPALIVVEPTPASLLAARRIRSIFDADGTRWEAVANKVRSADDAALIAADLKQPLCEVPFDPALRAVEREGSLLEMDMDRPAAAAVASLARAWTDEATEVSAE